jgi:peptide deformylase
MALRQIRNYKTNDVLRKKAKLVEKIDERLQMLISDMFDTMYRADGVGLAAPQVGILKRVVVIDVGDGDGVHALINPEFVSQSGEEIDFEGCLSIPGIRGKVKRPANVTVKALDRNGKEIVLEASGMLARALCHEIDHLDGVLFIDKAISGTLEE